MLTPTLSHSHLLFSLTHTAAVTAQFEKESGKRKRLALWLDHQADWFGPDPSQIDDVPVYAHVKVGDGCVCVCL